MPTKRNRKALLDLAIRRQVLLERIKAGQFRDFGKTIQEVQKLVQAKVGGLANDLAGENRRFLTRWLGQLESAILKQYREGVKLFNQELEQTAGIFAAMEAGDIAASITGTVRLSTPTARQAWNLAKVQAMSHSGETLEQFVETLAAGETKRVVSVVRRGYYQGKTNQELVREIVGTRARRFQDGILQTSRRNAQAVVATSVQHVASVGRMRTWQDNADVVQGYEWVSTLDRKTTTQCFTGSTIPRPIGEILKVFRRPYQGDVFVITTSAGEQFRATPNHPILTAKGWRSAKEIKPSDKVVDFSLDQFIPETNPIEVEPSFATIADALFHPSVSQIVSECPTPADFHGDGQSGQNQIDIAVPKPELGDGFNPFPIEDVRHKTLIWLHQSGFFSDNRGFGLLGVTGLPSVETPQFTTSTLQSVKKTASANTNLTNNFRGSESPLKHIDGFDCSGMFLVPRDIFKDTETFQKCGRRSSSSTKPSPNFGSGNSIAPKLQDVIGVRTEFVSCHVYNFETSSGYYMAGCSLVKNCKTLDGQKFKVGEGPVPPIHIRCRSTTVADLNPKFDFLKEGRTRSGEKGPVDADLDYYDWLKNQPPGFQDQALGPVRGKLFREGGLSADKFAELQLDRNFEPLTLAEMRKLEPEAFEAAGL